MNYTYIVLIVYVIGFLAYAFISSRKETREDFIVAGRDQNFWPLAASMNSSWVNMGWMAFLFSLFLTNIWGFLSLQVGIFLGLLALWKIVPDLRALAQEHNLTSLSDFTYKVVGSKAGYSVALINIILYIGWLTVELVASGHVLSAIFDIDYSVALIALSLVVCCYLLLGGFKVLIKTDILQLLFVLIFIIVCYVFISVKPLSQSTLQSIFKTDDMMHWGLLFLGATGLVWSEVWQRVFAAKDTKTARRVVLWSHPITLLIYFPLLILPLLSFDLFMPGQSDGIIGQIVANHVPSYLLPIILVLLLGMITSTLDTAGFVGAQSFMNDGLCRLPFFNNDKPRIYLRYGIFIVFIIAVSFGLFYQNVVDIMYFILNMWAVLPALIVGVLFKKPVRDLSVALSIYGLAIFMCSTQAFGVFQEWFTPAVFVSSFILPYIIEFFIDKICKLK